ncbi:hypothetical protein HDV04_006325 [Boothiomyces sp. JEL0838]|nr:hypothetical protein HDV04_006325 [Boothiomyces sp. JEL0838]
MEIQKFQFLSLAICTSILAAKYIITLSIQGSKRFDAGSRPPEDSKFDRGKQTFGMDLEIMNKRRLVPLLIMTNLLFEMFNYDQWSYERRHDSYAS